MVINFRYFLKPCRKIYLFHEIVMIHRLFKYCLSASKDHFWREVNPRVIQAQYAVRGIVPNTAGQIEQQLKEGSKKYPFTELTYCNIGNPQAFGQKPISFNRQVLACLLDTSLLQNSGVNPDVKNRAKRIIDDAVSIGGYSHSMGLPVVRESVVRYIEKEDQVPRPSINDIFLTEGASQGVHLIINCMISSEKDAIMIPIPQYPLYSASITLYGGTAAPYYLDESKGWQLDIKELERSYQEQQKAGRTVRAICMINPGNPTGAIFSEETIRDIIEFAVKRRIVVIADEVYRTNIYKEGASFISARAVLQRMAPEYRDKCELASMHSVSKGLTGECGLRGGYLYLHNFASEVWDQILKLKSINLCSNTIGQSMVQLLVNPPLEGVSETTKSEYQVEVKALYDSLKQRALMVTKELNQMKNVKSVEVEGAMYAFPSITFSKKAIAAAQAVNQAPDLFYCLQVLRNTGIVVVPGSGFKQVPGTYHFRITTLILPEDKLQSKLQDLKSFNNQFHQKYAD